MLDEFSAACSHFCVAFAKCSEPVRALSSDVAVRLDSGSNGIRGRLPSLFGDLCLRNFTNR